MHKPIPVILMNFSRFDANEPSQPRISVVIPTRNRADLLARALDAIKAQSFQAFEVVVIDDGSDVRTKSRYQEMWATLDHRFIFRSLGDDTMRGVGPSVTRNLGIAAARGDIIAFCDDDDFWTATDHLQSMSDVFAANSGVDMYIANQTGVSSKGMEITNWFPRLQVMSQTGSAVQNAPGLVTVDALCDSGSFAHLNILALRKATILQAGGFWERVSYEEDRDFYWRTLDCCNQVYFNPSIIGQHNIPDAKRADNQSTQHSVVERWLLAILVCQHICSTVRQAPIADLARRYEGDILRRVATHFIQAGRSAVGLEFARRALGARFSFKWSAYLTLLSFKAMQPKKAP